MDYMLRAVELSAAAHGAHDADYFDHVTEVARRVKNDTRSDRIHVATAYLINIGYMARVTTKELILAGIPGDVVRAVGTLEYTPDEKFLSYLRRVSEHPICALVLHHHYTQYLEGLDPLLDDEMTARFRRAASELNEAVNLNTPKANSWS